MTEPAKWLLVVIGLVAFGLGFFVVDWIRRRLNDGLLLILISLALLVMALWIHQARAVS